MRRSHSSSSSSFVGMPGMVDPRDRPSMLSISMPSVNNNSTFSSSIGTGIGMGSSAHSVDSIYHERFLTLKQLYEKRLNHLAEVGVVLFNSLMLMRIKNMKKKLVMMCDD